MLESFCRVRRAIEDVEHKGVTFEVHHLAGDDAGRYHGSYHEMRTQWSSRKSGELTVEDILDRAEWEQRDGNFIIDGLSVYQTSEEPDLDEAAQKLKALIFDAAIAAEADIIVFRQAPRGLVVADPMRPHLRSFAEAIFTFLRRRPDGT